MIITSLQNSKVKRLVALRKRSDREKAGVVVVEGHDELRGVVENGVKLLELYVCPELMGAERRGWLKELEVQVAPVELTRPVFEKVAYRESPDGWLAVAPAPPTQLERLSLGVRPLVLVAEGMEKPGNLGAMLRTAAAVGADAVIAADTVADWSNPNVVRASKGALFAVPVAQATTAGVVAWLRAHGVRLVAAAPRSGQTLWECDMAGGGVAVAVGAEHAGLSEAMLAAANERVEIPMQEGVDSLNAGVAAALMLYEAVRQRR